MSAGEYTLTAVDTAGIQHYIFGTNNLRQNVGASYLVDCVTGKWMVEALPPRHNVVDFDSGSFSGQQIEADELDAEVIYSGGGNAFVLFAQRELALEFARRLTRRVVLDAPGLQVVIAHRDFGWSAAPLGGPTGVMRQAADLLRARKASPRESVPLLGLSVTAACTYTGLPAVGTDDRRPIGVEPQAKVKAWPEAHHRLLCLVDHDLRGYDIPTDFDDFGRTRGESSYVAVVHTDGNAMSLRVQRVADRHPSVRDNRAYVLAMRAFSMSVRRAAVSALRATVAKLVESVSREDGKTLVGRVVELRDNKLPFRPIVFGGDDLTFVCDGRLGLALAAHYLKHFSEQELADGRCAHCRAGVAVVKTHYPFSRAFDLAAALCQSARDYIGDHAPDRELTAMDWHFAVGGLVRKLEEVRAEDYRVPREGSLCMRPVRISAPRGDWRSWDTFTQVAREFQGGASWAGRRNKVLGLREVLRRGPAAVENFLALHGGEQLPAIPGMPDMASQGWQGKACGYFDAVEALDFFVPL